MSALRKRARSLRRADSASELPLLREAMAAPDGASKFPEEEGDEGEHVPQACNFVVMSKFLSMGTLQSARSGRYACRLTQTLYDV